MKKRIQNSFFAVLFFLTLPLSAHAVFESERSLLAALASSGVGTIVEIPHNDFSTGLNIKVHTLVGTNGDKNTTSIDGYSHGREDRLQDLDYVYNSTALLAPDRVAEAWQVEDVFLCYRRPPSALQRLRGEVPTFHRCFLFPRQVSEIVQALRDANKIP